MAAFTPETAGRGVWWVIHMLAKNEVKSFPQTMEAIGEYFFCEDICKPHIKSYISRNPIPRDSRRWYQWTIDFHNAVNARLGKRQLSRSEVDDLFTPQYNEDGSCKSCIRTIPSEPQYYTRGQSNHVHNFNRAPANYQFIPPNPQTYTLPNGYQPFGNYR